MLGCSYTTTRGNPSVRSREQDLRGWGNENGRAMHSCRTDDPTSLSSPTAWVHTYQLSSAALAQHVYGPLGSGLWAPNLISTLSVTF